MRKLLRRIMGVVDDLCTIVSGLVAFANGWFSGGKLLEKASLERKLLGVDRDIKRLEDKVAFLNREFDRDVNRLEEFLVRDVNRLEEFLDRDVNRREEFLDRDVKFRAVHAQLHDIRALLQGIAKQEDLDAQARKSQAQKSDHKEQSVEELRNNHDAKVTQLRKEKNAKVTQLRTDKDAKVTQLRKEKDAEVGAMERQAAHLRGIRFALEEKLKQKANPISLIQGDRIV